MQISKLSLIFLSNSLNGGGAERSLLEIYRAVDRGRCAVQLWRLDARTMYPQYLEPQTEGGVLPAWPKNAAAANRLKRVTDRLPPPLARAGASKLLIDGLRLLHRLRDFASASAPDPILISSQFSMNIRVAILQWLCGYRIPVIFVEQNEPHLRYWIGEKEEVRNDAWTKLRVLYPPASRIVAVSAAVRASLVLRFGVPPQRISTIPNPVRLADARSARAGPPPPHPFYWSGRPVLLCLSRFIIQKNHFLLLRGFARARAVRPMKLILLGQGELKGAVERTVSEMGLGEDVAVLDFQSEPFPYVAHANVVTLSSYCEGSPLALLEALACGVPVLSTNWPGADEIVRHRGNGILCEMNDEAYAEGLLAALDLAQSEGVRKACLASVQQMDSRLIARKYVELAERVARDHPPGRRAP